MRGGSALLIGMLFTVTLLTGTPSSLAADVETHHGGRAIGDHAFVGMTDYNKLVVFNLATGDPVPPTIPRV